LVGLAAYRKKAQPVAYYSARAAVAIFIGEVKYRGEILPGEQPAIIGL